MIKPCVALAASLFAASAFAQQLPPPTPPMAANSSPADKTFIASLDKMNQSMTTAQLSGNADQDYATLMIIQAQGTTDFAKAELQYGKNDSLRRIAQHILAGQQREIAALQSWQKANPAAK